MIQRRLITLLGIAIALFSFLVLIPKAPSMKPSRLLKELPDYFSTWTGVPLEPGTREKQILAKDTEFTRMSYTSYDSSNLPIEVSLVFSGKNVSESIHRPEVCLRAQGWEFVSEGNVVFEELLPGGEQLPFRQIVCRRNIMKQESEDAPPEAVLAPSGEPASQWRVFYYTFFGYEAIISGHYERTILDMRSRIVGGYDQRWAYATFSTPISAMHREQGFALYPRAESLDEEGCFKHVNSFLSELVPLVVKPPRQGIDHSLVSLATPSKE